ncbi:hypothetical protein [Mycolicibacterium mageritense]|uniref:hypothetical protein n=1 Tax=Mycolicibacterium mageritense TaxID=53462 RepID=UPI0011DC60A8|nr:hypothetical protein [Mycolicibacterium mageritense]TXI64877.1 MAG: hypothetical protein E6Q55_04575 [Mycolicibacterium mageritense]
MTTPEELEARVAALEANQADYRAVLAAVNALDANQRETALTVREHTTTLERLEAKADDTNARVRSLEDNVSEIKDLLVQALEK